MSAPSPLGRQRVAAILTSSLTVIYVESTVYPSVYFFSGISPNSLKGLFSIALGSVVSHHIESFL